MGIGSHRSSDGASGTRAPLALPRLFATQAADAPPEALTRSFASEAPSLSQSIFNSLDSTSLGVNSDERAFRAAHHPDGLTFICGALLWLLSEKILSPNAACSFGSHDNNEAGTLGCFSPRWSFWCLAHLIFWASRTRLRKAS
ncbi:unnamed protein product [Lasius platythorax]|uniref:Uncharacterized protein n=1 Tax=Lasius platythorax TaxID=488582 RepID=A0AAV2MZC5_9HYME